MPMTISVATPDDCKALALTALHLDATELDLLSPEALAGSLRRAASFLCPTTPRRLVDAVIDAVQPLYPTTPLDRHDLTDLVELLVSAGDLIELPPDPQGDSRLMYLGPPAFVEQRPGRYLLMGIRPFGAPLLDADLDGCIEYKRHTRSIALAGAETKKHLRSLGLHPIALSRWVSAPAKESAEATVAVVRTRLDAAGRAGNVANLRILDPTTSLRFYRKRWRRVGENDNGDFVARRSQEYGSDLWCYVRVAAGLPERLVDFPTGDASVPGRDEAWRLQAAIDATHGCQHVFRLMPSQKMPQHTFVDFFAPVPTWTERYLEVAGTAVSEGRNCLFSYLVPDAAMPTVTGYLGEMLWMRVAGTGGTR
ncbi:hypothetical protein [Nocardia nova]